MRVRSRYVLAIGAVLAVTMIGSACAARGARNKTRVGAAAVGELALALDKAERDVYSASIPEYTKAAHIQVGAGIHKVIVAAIAYERGAASWPEGQPADATIVSLQLGVNAALDELALIIPPVAGVKRPLDIAIAAIRAVLAKVNVAHSIEGVTMAGLDLMGLMAILNLIGSLLASGRLTYAKLKALLQKEGITDAEFADLDARLLAAKKRREEEAAEAASDGA